ncbi:BadF/BadG/BcrA/BcrD ATPase family protein [Arthrobacter dokdonensis]|uniref:BadF/BadG/BcrA/BcrD ATPase family protein n=1 Tax=Arthrobacter dokdonellae TaxID=2211210 RepID=UPI000DE5AF78|nr:BadF/BadG/BcrA/BcrD ATPase family protein [Arthrobacter dokdonellae]
MKALPRLLAIDAGQTGIKLRHREGPRVEEWSLPGIRTDRPLPAQLRTVLTSVAGRGLRADSIGIGASGLIEGEADPDILLEAAGPLDATSLVLAHDSITAYLGALGDERGVVVAAGTGVVTLAVGIYDVARVDGWGNIIGDAGSGYWIGRAALDAVMRAHDGRGPQTALTAAVRKDFPDLESAYIELQGDVERVRRVAAYSRTVGELAGEDPVAATIIAAAGSELALAAACGLRRVGEATAPCPKVCAIGGAFTSPHLAAAFDGAVRTQIPEADIAVGLSNPLDGAEKLTTLAPESALTPNVLHSRPREGNHAGAATRSMSEGI